MLLQKTSKIRCFCCVALAQQAELEYNEIEMEKNEVHTGQNSSSIADLAGASR